MSWAATSGSSSSSSSSCAPCPAIGGIDEVQKLVLASYNEPKYLPDVTHKVRLLILAIPEVFPDIRKAFSAVRTQLRRLHCQRIELLQSKEALEKQVWYPKVLTEICDKLGHLYQEYTAQVVKHRIAEINAIAVSVADPDFDRYVAQANKYRMAEMSMYVSEEEKSTIETAVHRRDFCALEKMAHPHIPSVMYTAIVVNHLRSYFPPPIADLVKDFWFLPTQVFQKTLEQAYPSELDRHGIAAIAAPFLDSTTVVNQLRCYLPHTITDIVMDCLSQEANEPLLDNSEKLLQDVEKARKSTHHLLAYPILERVFNVARTHMEMNLRIMHKYLLCCSKGTMGRGLLLSHFAIRDEACSTFRRIHQLTFQVACRVMAQTQRRIKANGLLCLHEEGTEKSFTAMLPGLLNRIAVHLSMPPPDFCLSAIADRCVSEVGQVGKNTAAVEKEEYSSLPSSFQKLLTNFDPNSEQVRLAIQREIGADVPLAAFQSVRELSCIAKEVAEDLLSICAVLPGGEKLLKSFDLPRYSLFERARIIEGWILTNPEIQAWQRLDLSRCELRHLPSVIFSLSHLQLLDISENWLTYISPRIRLLRHLREIDASNNLLQQIPSELGDLPLSYICLEGNALMSLPATIVHRLITVPNTYLECDKDHLNQETRKFLLSFDEYRPRS